MRKYCSRKYLESDKENIVKLLQRVFDGWPKISLKFSPINYWEWKYENRVVDQKIIQVIGSSNEIFGCGHSVLANIKLFNDIIIGSLGGDVAVDPEFRQMGFWKIILYELTKYRKESNVKYNYLVTGNPVVINYFNKISDYAKFPVPLINLVKIENIELQLEKMPMKNPLLFNYGYRGLSFLNKIFQEETDYPEEIRIIKVKAFPDEINKFYNHVSGNFDYIIERKSDYLNWRYCDKRGGDYQIYVAYNKNEIIGYISIIINNYNPNYSIGYISDLLVNEDHIVAGDLLVQESLQYFKRNEVNIVNFLTVKDSVNESIARRSGFINSRKEIGFYYSHLGDSSIKKRITRLKSKKIHITWGDTDILPVSI